MDVPFLRLRDALIPFAQATATQGQEHIKPLHEHIALRLVIEGGFLPEEITPRPPLRSVKTRGAWFLEHAPEAQSSSELTVFGGMKTKKVDVVVSKAGIGPVVAVSIKGTIKAYRNLVNRMEEAIGDSTNIHVMYPGLVYGFLHILRANREEHGYGRKDTGLTSAGPPMPGIERYAGALCEMVGRRFVRNDYTRYESVGLLVVDNSPGALGDICSEFPASESPLHPGLFFKRLLEVYDIRFPLRGESVRSAHRVVWQARSPFFRSLAEDAEEELEAILGYTPRLVD
jgi:hypothetical protein